MRGTFYQRTNDFIRYIFQAIESILTVGDMGVPHVLNIFCGILGTIGRRVLLLEIIES